MRSGLRTGLVLAIVAGSPACAEPEPPAARLVGHRTSMGLDGDHLVELVRVGEVLFVTNANESFAAVEAPSGAGMRELFPIVPGRIRCTTADLHPTTDTLVCANEYDDRLYAWDVSDPAQPRATWTVDLPDDTPVADLHVREDELWIAAHGRGLWRAELGPAAPTNIELAAEPGNVRRVEHRGEDLVLLVRDRGLVELRGSGSSWAERRELALEGPTVDLHVDGDRWAVARGSLGVVVVDAGGDALDEVARLEPPAVASAVATSGDLVAIGSTTGLYLYDLGGEDGADWPAGYHRTGGAFDAQPGTVMDLRFDGESLYASDWYTMWRFEVAETGAILDVDMPAGMYLGSQEGFAVRVRNFSDFPHELELRAPGGVIARATLPARSLQLVSSDLDVERLRQLLPPDAATMIRAVRRDANGAVLGDDGLLVLRVADGHEPALNGKPPPGAVFPPIALEGWEDDPDLLLPEAGRRQRVMWLTDDCQAMWPVVEDAAWLGSAGGLDGGAAPVLATPAPLAAGAEGVTFLDRLGIAGVGNGYHENVSPEVAEVNAALEPLYAFGFAIERLRSAAAHPTDYLVDAEGRVEAVEREYRGAFPLRGETSP